MVETETMDEDPIGLISNVPAINEANINPSVSTQQSNQVPLPETLSILQNPPELVCCLHSFYKNKIFTI